MHCALCILVLLITSCVSPKRLRYFQDKNPEFSSPQMDTTYDAIIQPNDILTIYVTCFNEEVAKFFNFSNTQEGYYYIVDHSGNIQMPLVGDIHVGGLTTKTARDSVSRSLEKYIINPIVRLNIRNFRVTILGAVGHPGILTVTNEKITLLEAIVMAGDLNTSSVKENIMIVREIDGRKEFAFVDITSREFFASPYYNLHANDIVYVQTAGRKLILSDNYISLITLIATPIATLFLLFRAYNVIK